MEYKTKTSSIGKNDAIISIKLKDIGFGMTSESEVVSRNPAELFFRSFGTSILKNFEQFSNLMMFTYAGSDIFVQAIRVNAPPKKTAIVHDRIIHSGDSGMKVNLLQKNKEKFGTTYNATKQSCKIARTFKVRERNASKNQLL